ncbi:MAG: DinB family protein, partial [Pirellulales bacterium]
NRDFIEQYAAGAVQPAAAIAGLSREQLNAFPVPGTWSIQQIVVHLMDSDLIGADRMKRVAAEDRPPTLIGYDESAFANKLFYDELDPNMACDVFAKNRLLTAEILRRLPAAAFQRTGNHNEHGVMTLAELLANYVEHLNHHLKFIHQKRKLLGCPA